MGFIAKHKWQIIGVIIAFIVINQIIKSLGNSGGKTTGGTTTGGGTGTPKPSFPCAKYDIKALIYYGQKNNCQVARVQEWLNVWFQSGLKIDGNYGPATKMAMEKAGKQTGGTLETLGIY